jgi:RND family efflux transporter MFP subunit
MKKAAFAVLVIGVFAAGFAAGELARSRDAVGAAGAPAKAVLYYVDPMHPSYRSDAPGVAPDCGMPLVPVYAGEGNPAASDRRHAPADGAVRLAPDARRLIGVEVEAVEEAEGRTDLRLYGRVAADETRSYRVDIGTEGYIRQVAPVTTGAAVRKDQWLATFAAPELRSPLQAYVVALEIAERSSKTGETPAQRDASEAALQLSEDRLMTFGVTRAQIEEIRRTRRAPQDVRIVAPVDGIVLSRNVSAGQKVDRGDELYRIADLARVWILADVAGPEAQQIPPGAWARITVPKLRRALRAQVTRAVRPQFDAGTQSVTLRLEAENPDDVLRPDMFVDVDLSVPLPRAITVPDGAVLDSGRRRIVFVERSDGSFVPRQVETGWRHDGRVEIVSGLSAGERVVVSGTFLVDSESRLRSAPPAVRPHD